jgi:DNA invertase Pin-like site-specific DNA recombinase
MSGYVEVRLRVRADRYRALLAEAERRKLDGAGRLLELAVNADAVRLPEPQAAPAPARVGRGRHDAHVRKIEPGDEVELVRRLRAGEATAHELAAEYGISRSAVYYWARRVDEHDEAMRELGVRGRHPVPHPAVPGTL